MGSLSKRDGDSKPSAILQTTYPYCALLKVYRAYLKGIDRKKIS